jgi:hypothetical protein
VYIGRPAAPEPSTGTSKTKARALAGPKGYVTSVPAFPEGTPVTAEFVIGACHQLFEAEKSFRMSEHDLQARPIYHHLRDSIQARLPSCSPWQSAGQVALRRRCDDRAEARLRATEVVHAQRLQMRGRPGVPVIRGRGQSPTAPSMRSLIRSA